MEDRRLLALTTTDLNTGLTPQDLAETLIGGGVTISNVQFVGDNSAGGIFAEGLSDGLGVEFGVVLSSGNIGDAPGPNDSDGTSTGFGLPGDADLNGLLPQSNTNDAAVLEFDFEVAAGLVTFQYVFASEEYNEFVNQFNDVFGFFLDGENIALVPGTSLPVSIDNVNNAVNSEFYNDNDPSDLGIPTPFGTEADGFTVPLQATAVITPGVHHIKLAIADALDTALDSWVFLTAESFVAGESDLEVEIVDSPDPVVVDNFLTYSVVATNNGPDPANGVAVEDVLPPGVTFVSATVSQGSIETLDGVVIAEMGTLASGASATLDIVVIANELGSITNSATVSALQPDPVTENNTTSEVTSVVLPTLSINDVQLIEGHAGTKNAVFTVSLNGIDVNSAITVSFQTVGVTATSGSDFVPRGGLLTIAPGTLTKSIVVPIIGDRFNELTETFEVHLSNASVEIVRNVGIGTIINDDPLPLLYVNDVQVTRMPAGAWVAVFSVALDVPSGREVVVDFETANGSALDGVDYTRQSGTLTFEPGATTQQVMVPVFADGAYTANKKFYLNLANPLRALYADRQGHATFVFAGGPTGERIIDNGDPGYQQTGGWTNLTNTLAYGLDYDHHAAGNGSAVATWNFADVPDGSYQVFARWSWFSNRASNAPYTILDGANPLATVFVNQQIAPADDYSEGISWQSLGTYQIDSGNLAVRLANNANGFVIADAVRVVAGGIAPQSPEMDVAGYEHSIDLGDDTPWLEDGTDFGQAPALTDSTIHSFTVTNHGNADLHLTGGPRVTLSGPHASDFSIISQPDAILAPTRNSTFEVIFHPTQAGVRTAVISIPNNDDSEHPYTFTVHGTGTLAGASQLVLDDSMLGFAQQGNWTTVANPLAYQGQMRTAAAGQTSDRAVWNFSGLAPGMYDVYTTWVTSANRATSAQFEVSNLSDHTYTTTVNQQQAPNISMSATHWATLGALYVSDGSLRVSLAPGVNGLAVADAVMIARHEGGVVQDNPIAHNYTLPQDVDDNGRVSPFDLLIVINDLIARHAEPAAAPLAATSGDTSPSTHYVDVSGDGRVSAIDVWMVINHLLGQQAAAPGAAPLVETSAGTDSALVAVAVDRAIALVDESAEASATELAPGVERVPLDEGAGDADSLAGLLFEPAGVESLLSAESEEPGGDDDPFDPLFPGLGN